MGFGITAAALAAVVGVSAGASAPLADCNDLLMASAAIQKLTEEEHWKTTGLTYNHLTGEGLIEPEQCRRTPLDFLICISALNALARSGKTQWMLLPKGLVKKYSKEIESTEMKFGDIHLVKLKAARPTPPGKSLKETFKRIMERETEYRESLEKVLTSGRFDIMTALAEIVELVRDPQNEAIQVGAAFNAAFNLEDPHAYILPTSLLEEGLRLAGMDTLVGVGIQLRSIDSHFYVDRVIKGGSAASAGLLVGDTIIAIDGRSTKKEPIAGLLGRITGREGTVVRFTVERKKQVIEVAVTRRRLEMKNVESEIVEDGFGARVGHIRLNTFANANACDEVKKAVQSLRDQGAKSLILDLRGNPGGLLDQGACIAGLFLGRELVAVQKDLESGNSIPAFGSHRKITSLPMVVLINGHSASASELVAGALRDHHRAWMVGERSFGKGTVQHATSYDESGRIVFYRTRERFHQPSGSSNQLVGITPNVTVFENPDATEEEFVAREGDLYVNAIPGSRKVWREDRPEEVRSLKSCMDSQGWAKRRWRELKESGKFADYQLLSAVELLGCQN